MASSSLPLLSLLLLVLSTRTPTVHAASRPILAPPAPANTTSSQQSQFLTPHNQARAAVGVPPLTWSLKLASNATLLCRHQQDGAGCAFADLSSSAYGANQAAANFPATPAEVVALWIAEGRYYTHANNSCAVGRECGTYTQVVWKRTTDVGCGRAVCPSGGSISICLYFPHGNVQGEIPY